MLPDVLQRDFVVIQEKRTQGTHKTPPKTFIVPRNETSSSYVLGIPCQPISKINGEYSIPNDKNTKFEVVG